MRRVGIVYVVENYTPEDREFWRIVLGLETVEERRRAFAIIDGVNAA